jgi:hypothetical protein
VNVPNDPYNTKASVNTTFTPTTVGDLRLSFFRFRYKNVPQSSGADLPTYGWSAISARR